MRNATYDLFRGTSRENAVWIGTVEGLQAATDRMSCLALSEPDDYFVFNAGNIVASARSPNTDLREVPWTIVIVSSDTSHVGTLTEVLKRQEMKAIHASTLSQYRDVLSEQLVGLVFCDPNLKDGDYRDVIQASRSMGSEARVVVTFRLSCGPSFIEAMREGAFDVIAKPCRPKDVEWMVIQAKRESRRTAKQLMVSKERSLARDAA
jgi:ActR/RegA family two-component response regulator